MYLQKVISKKNLIFCCLLEGHWRKLQDPESDPDPYQNVTDLQHFHLCFKICYHPLTPFLCLEFDTNIFSLCKFSNFLAAYLNQFL
jgi:hypothetical protein